ncbi:MAG: hypothetical protein KF745_01995 [Phycisphaeraceae bacterium]|nr:hypothetical protein [Phycisphaeraceae bacterium]
MDSPSQVWSENIVPAASGILPSAPPTRAGALPARRTVWPSVVGIVALVIGALGVLMNAWGVLMMLVPAVSPGMSSVNNATMQAFETYAPLLLPCYLAGVVLAVTLGVSGVGLLQRRRWGARLVWGWGWVKILQTVAASIGAALMQRAQMVGMVSSTPVPAGMPAGMPDVVMVLTLIMSMAWGLALPVFVLVWLSLRTIREQTATWR